MTENKNPYNPKKDGSLKDYLARMNELSENPVFSGYRAFRKLWNHGFIEPDVTQLTFAGSGEHYLVTGKDSLAGLVGNGTHDARSMLFKGPAWEAQMLNRHPKKRK
jgi:hypothetical protein